jgi:hypothetical protein
MKKITFCYAGWSVIFLPLFLYLPNVHAYESFYKKYKRSSCPTKLTQTELKQVKSEFLPNALDQGQSGTCFAHSAFYLLQYLFNQFNNSSSIHLSRTDVFSQGCMNQTGYKGGLSSTVLYHVLKDRNLEIEPSQVTFDRLVQNSSEINSCIQKNQIEECYSQIMNLLDPDSQLKWQISPEFIQQILEEHPKNFTASLVRKLPNKEVRELPPYNIFTVESDDGADLQKKVRSHFEMNEPYPLSLGFCTREDEFGVCLGKHTVTITGVRKLCCGIPEKDRKNCHEEWNLLNSYGPGNKKQGWHLASALSESVV